MIRINDNYYIDVDEYNYVVCKPTNSIDKKTGKRVFRSLGYYGNFMEALKAIICKTEKTSLDTDDVITLSEAIKKLNTAYENVLREIKSAIPDASAYDDLS